MYYMFSVVSMQSREKALQKTADLAIFLIRMKPKVIFETNINTFIIFRSV